MTNLIFERYIYASQIIKKNETITKNKAINLRPLFGIRTNCLYRILGKIKKILEKELLLIIRYLNK